MKKYNVISWSLVVALAATLEQTISKQVPLESFDVSTLIVSQQSAALEDEGKTIFTEKRKTTTDGSDHPINEQRLKQINNVLARYE